MSLGISFSIFLQLRFGHPCSAALILLRKKHSEIRLETDDLLTTNRDIPSHGHIFLLFLFARSHLRTEALAAVMVTYICLYL